MSRHAALLVALALAACGEKTDNGSPDAADVPDAGVRDGGAEDGNPSASNWCERFAAAFCGAVARCGWPGEERSEGTCRVSVLRDCPAGAALHSSVAAGRIAFDSSAAQQCVGGLAALSCEDFREGLRAAAGGPVPACAGVLAGRATANQECPLGLECAASHTCRFDATCPGKCLAYAAENAACDASTPCDPARALCLDGVCKAVPATAQAACPDGFCLAPLVCNTKTARCEPPALAGGACGANGSLCFPGLVCLQASPAAEGTCERPRAKGQSCFSDADCGLGTGGETLVCAGGTCDTAPGPEAPCADFRCNNAWCDTTRIPPTCKALPGNAAPCAQRALCAAGLYCAAGTCRALVAAGDDCAAHAECADGRCYGGRCVAAGAPVCEP